MRERVREEREQEREVIERERGEREHLVTWKQLTAAFDKTKKKKEEEVEEEKKNKSVPGCVLTSGRN